MGFRVYCGWPPVVLSLYWVLTGLDVAGRYDKITGNHLQEEYMKTIVEKSPPFLPENKTRLQAQIERLTSLYARVVTRGDLEKASRQLKGYLREHVVWERNTVWREMVAMERTGGWKGAGGTQPQVQSGQDAGTKSEIKTPVGRVVLPSWINRSFVFGIVALAVFVGLLNTPWFERPEERNCLALLAFVTIMWAAEVGRLGGRSARASVLTQYLFAGHPLLRYLDARTLPSGHPRSAPIHRRQRQTFDGP